MAKSTGPILAAGGISALDQVVLKKGSPVQVIPIAVATGIAALLLGAAEKVSQPLAVGIAWIALVTVVLTSGVVTDLTNTTGLGKKS
jgi:hypothetical protein